MSARPLTPPVRPADIAKGKLVRGRRRGPGRCHVDESACDSRTRAGGRGVSGLSFGAVGAQPRP
jgi:hypothetical protein